MHDFHLADTIYKAIIEEAEKNNLKKITKAIIELGSIIEHGDEILPANLDFNIKLLAQGSLNEGIELIIDKASGNNWALKEIEGE